MKIIILSLLICLTISYKTVPAIEYARKYCRYSGPYYDYDMKDEPANFVSKCLIAGGMNFSGCSGVNNKGAIPSAANLRSCLISKGWKYSKGISKQFKAGYPFFSNNQHSMIATYVKGKFLKYCAHANDRCDKDLTAPDDYYYYYL